MANNHTPSDTPTQGAGRNKQEVGQKNSTHSSQISVHIALSLIKHTQWVAVCMGLP